MDMELLDIPAPAHDALPSGSDWRRLLDHIEAHLDDDLGTHTLARAYGLEADRFAQLFSAAVGVPPHRYVAYRRMERAQRRMAALWNVV